MKLHTGDGATDEDGVVFLRTSLLGLGLGSWLGLGLG